MKRELILFTAKVAIVVAVIVIIGMITGGYELRLELWPKAKKKEPNRERAPYAVAIASRTGDPPPGIVLNGSG